MRRLAPPRKNANTRKNSNTMIRDVEKHQLPPGQNISGLAHSSMYDQIISSNVDGASFRRQKLLKTNKGPHSTSMFSFEKQSLWDPFFGQGQGHTHSMTSPQQQNSLQKLGGRGLHCLKTRITARTWRTVQKPNVNATNRIWANQIWPKPAKLK